jgi:predicted transcriptional regulator
MREHCFDIRSRSLICRVRWIMGELWATTTLTDSITGTILDVWIVWSLNPMKSSKVSLKRKSASILKRVPARRAAPTRVGVESMDNFFSRMKDNARELDRGKAVEPGFHLSFEDPADFLEVITPARVRLLREISTEPVTLSALALILARDPSAVRRDVALLESQSLVTTSKVSNAGHGKRTVVRRVATRIELAAVV